MHVIEKVHRGLRFSVYLYFTPYLIGLQKRNLRQNGKRYYIRKEIMHGIIKYLLRGTKLLKQGFKCKETANVTRKCQYLQ